MRGGVEVKSKKGKKSKIPKGSRQRAFLGVTIFIYLFIYFIFVLFCGDT
jgi:hypothetical protein